MKDELDKIFSRKDEDIREISRYKAAGRKEKEKIYELSMKRYADLKSENGAKDGGDYTLKAEGVERYSRPAWYRGLCAAAASVLLMGGVLGGVMLSRSSKVQPMDHSRNTAPTAVTVEATTSEDDIDKNAVVDALISNIEMIQKPQYPGTESVDYGDCIYFNKDEYSAEAGKIVNLTKYYYAVTDERLDSMEKVEDVLKDTFIYDVRRSYLGGDLSSYETGYDFKDDNLANSYVSTFIKYNGKVYAQSRCEYNKTYAYGFDQLYNFSSYELVSSVFAEGQGLYINRIYYDENGESISPEDIMTCKRVYKRPDGERVDAVINIITENDVWKVVSFNAEPENSHDDINSNDDPASGTESPSDSGEFAELDPHELTILPSYEEAEAFSAGIEKERGDGTYKFRKVDVEKYCRQIIDAKDQTELNTNENKSFIYHMMWNSYRYFDTAKVSYTVTSAGTAASTGEAYTIVDTVENISDTRSKYCRYSSERENGNHQEKVTYYYYDSSCIVADDKNMHYSENDYFENSENEYIPDNYRVVYNSGADGEDIRVNRVFSNDIFAGTGSECLYPYAELFNVFTDWAVYGTENILGRECAHIIHSTGADIREYYIDLRTGVIMKSVERLSDPVTTTTMEVTSIEFDTPIDYIYFDPTGYINTEKMEKKVY